MIENLKEAILSEFPAIEDARQIPEFKRPPDSKLGDYAMNCGPLAKILKHPANQIANAVSAAVSTCPEVSSASVAGAFVNIRLQSQVLFSAAVQVPTNKNANGQRIMVEYLSPNTNKPLHLGHLRNGSLGSSLANILEAAGYEVVRANLVNDRGVHICQSMVSWQKFANGATPASTGMKGDHFVGDWYVRFARESQNDPLKDISFGWQENIGTSRVFVMHFPLRGEAIVRVRELRVIAQAARV